MEKIIVTAIDVRPTMENWIAKRGGVRVWVNHDLGSSDIGGMKFTPELDKFGNPKIALRWDYVKGELVVDINRFKFVKEWVELGRIRIAFDRRGRLTDFSQRKIRDAEKLYPDAYHSDTDNERVYEIPIFEGD